MYIQIQEDNASSHISPEESSKNNAWLVLKPIFEEVQYWKNPGRSSDDGSEVGIHL
jgi:hypothetical protein